MAHTHGSVRGEVSMNRTPAWTLTRADKRVRCPNCKHAAVRCPHEAEDAPTRADEARGGAMRHVKDDQSGTPAPGGGQHTNAKDCDRPILFPSRASEPREGSSPLGPPHGQQTLPAVGAPRKHMDGPRDAVTTAIAQVEASRRLAARHVQAPQMHATVVACHG